MEDGRTRKELSARRCLEAAVERMGEGDFKAAVSLFRATARYLEGVGEENDATGVVVAFPSPTAVTAGARFAAVMQ